MTAKERARQRIVAWFARPGAPSQQEFSERLGRTQSWASRLLQEGPTIDNIDAIAEQMGCSAAELIAPGTDMTWLPPVPQNWDDMREWVQAEVAAILGEPPASQATSIVELHSKSSRRSAKR